MMKIDIPTSNKQVFLIGMLIAVPLLLATFVYYLTPHQTVPDAMETGLVGAILVTSGLFALVLCASMLMRHSVDLGADAIVVRHAFYTFRLARADIRASAIERLPDVRSLGITTKRNGIAAVGYYSGWFNASKGERVFMAVSGVPLVVLRFTGHPKCSVLAMSSSGSLETDLAAWLAQGSAALARGGLPA
ncbi:hypothetical protein INH39_24735 [Massilia violaceinigra]|uniref:Bacterial Pleckstrin homology domain-containing protein n=1 Tax=Massilia violaceinigra TaxID=2045208 RepID=A0ABY4A1J7_9BURK|nr:hypothetical protein [Massilia violaceinigra]UOD28626.1 hypothetical protein INH39_24735 [Massilia violaceinigra]